MIEIRPVSGIDPALKAMLEAAGLPIDDLEEAGRVFFAAIRDSVVRGFGGLETANEDVLLRSIAVAPGDRGQGIGRAMTLGLLDRARTGRAAKAFLLTTSAAAFFERLGFTSIERTDAPEAILQTRQAALLCPASAVLMRKYLLS